jgi:hypothetical protein
MDLNDPKRKSILDAINTDGFRLPPLTHRPTYSVDATPDEDYPLRILRAYLRDCETRWIVEGLSEEAKLVFDVQNEHQVQRAQILTKAIQILEEHSDGLK